MCLNKDVQLENDIVPPEDLAKVHQAKIAAAIQADLDEVSDEQLSREAERLMQRETGVCPGCHDLLFKKNDVVACYQCHIIRPVHMVQPIRAEAA